MKDLTVEILCEIRDEIRSTNTRLAATSDGLNARIDETNHRLEKLHRQQVAAELRVATELIAIAGVMGEVRDSLAKDRELRGTVADHEVRIRRLEGASH